MINVAERQENTAADRCRCLCAPCDSRRRSTVYLAPSRLASPRPDTPWVKPHLTSSPSEQFGLGEGERKLVVISSAATVVCR